MIRALSHAGAHAFRAQAAKQRARPPGRSAPRRGRAGTLRGTMRTGPCKGSGHIALAASKSHQGVQKRMPNIKYNIVHFENNKIKCSLAGFLHSADRYDYGVPCRSCVLSKCNVPCLAVIQTRPPAEETLPEQMERRRVSAGSGAARRSQNPMPKGLLGPRASAAGSSGLALAMRPPHDCRRCLFAQNALCGAGDERRQGAYVRLCMPASLTHAVFLKFKLSQQTPIS